MNWIRKEAISNEKRDRGSGSEFNALAEQAQQTVQQWHEAENYPFPDFSFEYKYEMKDSAIYPDMNAAVRKDGSTES